MGEKSECSDVESGILQGSVLGPVLFVLFINDLPSVVQSVMKIFTDDTKVYNCVKDYKGVVEPVRHRQHGRIGQQMAAAI